MAAAGFIVAQAILATVTLFTVLVRVASLVEIYQGVWKVTNEAKRHCWWHCIVLVHLALWVCYASLLVADNMAVMIVNVLAFCVESIHFCLESAYASRDGLLFPILFALITTLSSALSVMIFLVASLADPASDWVKKMFGISCIVATVFMHVLFLAMKYSVGTESIEPKDLKLIVLNMTSALCWSLVGFLHRNPYVAIGYSMGMAVGLCQILVDECIRVRKKNTQIVPEITASEIV